MSREIKYQAYNTEFKEMNGDEYAKLLLYKISCGGDHPEIIFREYTGLKDKNGKEIYEGDISMPGKGEIFWDEKRSMFKVRWHDKTWKETRTGIRSGKDSLYEGSEPLLTNEFAFGVVGNIYENPELLKD